MAEMSGGLSRFWVTRADYDFGKTGKRLGKGAFGRVVEATDRKTGKLVAVKFLKQRFEEQSQERSFIRELEILASNSHPATLRLLGFGIDPDGTPMVVTDVMTHGTLDKVLKEEARGAHNTEWNATRQSICVFGICAGMAHLHAQGIVHRDLKLENVFLNEQWEPVVADFGLSRALQEGIHRTMEIGTPLHMAPELYGDNEYSFPVDVYAFAVLLYSFFTEPTRLDDKKGALRHAEQLLQRVNAGARFVKPAGIPDTHWDLISAAWRHDPKQRPTFQELVNDFHLNHRYVFPGADLTQVLEYENRLLEYEAPPVIEKKNANPPSGRKKASFQWD
jgi:serine/threonine protein kinase